jgi:hypothetical protein
MSKFVAKQRHVFSQSFQDVIRTQVEQRLCQSRSWFQPFINLDVLACSFGCNHIR